MSKKIINRFDCLLDDDDDVVIPNNPKDNFPTLKEKTVNIHDKQQKKKKWVEPKATPKVEPKVEPKATPKIEPKVEPKATPKVEPNIDGLMAQYRKISRSITDDYILTMLREDTPVAPKVEPEKKDKKKKPSPKNKQSPKNKEAVAAEPKKDKKEENRRKMLAQMNGGELPTAASAAVAMPIAPPPKPWMVEKPVPPSWVTMTINKSKPSKVIMKNYHEPEEVEECPESAIDALCYNFRRYRQDYIDNFGTDAYNARYMSPWHDYHRFDRGDNNYKMSLQAFNKYDPDNLPYAIAPDGTVDDVIIIDDSKAESDENTDYTTDDYYDVLGKYSNINTNMYV